MRRKILGLMSCLAPLVAYQPAFAADGLCGPLRDFVESVEPGEIRVLKFHTIWGENFKDREGKAFGAKRCDFANYEPARAVCVFLMEYGSIETAGYNAKVAIECASKKTQFPVHTELNSISVSLPYGIQDPGRRIKIELRENNEVGGLELAITAEGVKKASS